jgi:hypothetical protein
MEKASTEAEQSFRVVPIAYRQDILPYAAAAACMMPASSP